MLGNMWLCGSEGVSQGQLHREPMLNLTVLCTLQEWNETYYLRMFELGRPLHVEVSAPPSRQTLLRAVLWLQASADMLCCRP